MEIKIYLVVIFGLVVIYGAARLYHAYMTNVEKVNEVEKKNKELDDRVQDIETSNIELAASVEDLVKHIKQLEKANRLRLPYQSVEAILDGMAALDARQREVQLEDGLIENARSHLAKALAAGTKRAK